MIYFKKVNLAAATVFALVSGANAADQRSANGVIVAKETAVLSTDLSASVSEIPYLVGATFNKGDVLIKFDCGLYEARLAGLKATYGKNAAKLKRAQNLHARKAAGIAEVNDAKADVAYARAEVAALEKQMEGCEVKAPYAGRVVEKSVNSYERPQPNSPLLSIVGNANLEVDLVVPSTWLSWLKVGEPFTMKVAETGVQVDGMIERIGAAVNSVSQTIRVYGRFEQTSNQVLPGMSGTVYFENQKLTSTN